MPPKRRGERMAEAEEDGDSAEAEADEAARTKVAPVFVPLGPLPRISQSGFKGSGPVGDGPVEVQPDKIEEVGEVFVVGTIQRDGTHEVLGMLSMEHQAIQVARGFMSKSEDTDIIEVKIDAWTVGRVGTECVREHLVLLRETCPVCARSTFWVEGEQERAECHDILCRAWIAPNDINDEIWNSGWPAAMETAEAEDFEEAYKDLIAMKGRATAAGSDTSTELAEEIGESFPSED